MGKSLNGFSWVGLLLACGLWTSGAGARAEEPWVRICSKPTLVDPKDLHCKARPQEYEMFNDFRVGCYNVTEGRWIDCEVLFQEYFSLEGVPPSERLEWTGGHDHSRASGDPERTLGAIRCDVDENAGSDPTRFHGQTQYQVFDAYKVMPEASGVIRMTGRYTCKNEQYRALPDDTWHLDPADPCGRTAYAEIAFVVGIEGLEELPDSKEYDKVSDHAGHSDPVFCGTPEMNRKLAELARQFKQSYPQESQVSFNDLSLKYGGLYDINQDWTCDHTLHREGKSADVNRTVPKTKLEKVAANLGFTECHPGKSLIHFELGPCEKKRST